MNPIALLAEVIVPILMGGLGYILGRNRANFRSRAQECEELERELEKLDPEERETRELVENIAAKRFPALAGK